MQIVRLESENVKRLYAVEITPENEVVVIGGNNAQGKSSVLDSITMALGGGETICDQPLRKGAKKGHTVIDLGDLIVTRTYTEGGGGSLTVASPNGVKYSSPQKMLDELVGRLSFDPLNFMRLKPAEQQDIVRQMACLNFAMLDDMKKKRFDERTEVNREVKRLEGQLTGLKFHQGAPEQEQSFSELSAELTKVQDHNNANAEKRRKAKEHEGPIVELSRKIVTLDTDIATLESRLESLKLERKAAISAKNEAMEVLEYLNDQNSKLEDIDAAPILAKIETCEATNQKARENARYKEVQAQLRAAQDRSEELTRKIQDIEEKKQAAIEKAKFPVEGLSFTDGGLTFNGVPLEQASSAEQLRVSVAIGMASNPKLKILLCRDGSLLDSKSLKMLSEIVKENGYQMWLERVGDGDESAVIIEDGRVRE